MLEMKKNTIQKMALSQAILRDPIRLRQVLAESPDNVLLDITRQKYEPRDLWITIAAELVDTPRFFRIPNGGLYFGSINSGFQPICPNGLNNEVQISQCVSSLRQTIGKYTGFQVMTLKEMAPEVYRRVAVGLPMANFLVNDTLHEVVNFYRQPEAMIEQVRARWSPNDEIRVVQRIFNFQSRKYRDVTSQMLESGLYNAVQLGSPATPVSPFSPESPESNLLVQERQQAQLRVNQEIIQRVETHYPMIKNIKQYLRILQPSNTNFYLMVDLNFVLPVFFVQQTGLSTNPQTRLAWRSELLPNPGNPTQNEMEFFMSLADVADYMKF